MSENLSNKPGNSDEIDLGQLFQMIGKGFNTLFRNFLKMFLYIKRNIYWFLGLGFAGLLLGFSLKFLTGIEKKLEVIVSPNLENATYLEDVVVEVRSNIKAQNAEFFQALDMDLSKMENFEIEIESLRISSDNENQYNSELLDLLKDFNENEAIMDILKGELQKQATPDKRIIFTFKNTEIGEEYAQKILDYINANSYYSELLKVTNENARNRIRRNDSLVTQIDILVSNYTEKLGRTQQSTEGRLVLENQESLDIPSLLQLKNTLIRDTEENRVVLAKRKEAITVVNFGKPFIEERPLFKRNIILFPSLFIGAFLFISLIGYLNKKATELERND